MFTTKPRLPNLDQLLNGETHLIKFEEVGWTGTMEDLRAYLYERAKVRGLHCRTSNRGLPLGQLSVQAFNPFEPGTLMYLAAELWLVPACTCGGVGFNRHWVHCEKVNKIKQLETTLKDLVDAADMRLALQRELVTRIQVLDPAAL